MSWWVTARHDFRPLPVSESHGADYVRDLEAEDEYDAEAAFDAAVQIEEERSGSTRRSGTSAPTSAGPPPVSPGGRPSSPSGRWRS